MLNKSKSSISAAALGFNIFVRVFFINLVTLRSDLYVYHAGAGLLNKSPCLAAALGFTLTNNYFALNMSHQGTLTEGEGSVQLTSSLG